MRYYYYISASILSRYGRQVRHLIGFVMISTSRLDTPPPVAREEFPPSPSGDSNQAIQNAGTNVAKPLQSQPEAYSLSRVPGKSPAVPKTMKSVRFDPLSWFRSTKPESLSPSTTSRKNSSESSISAARSRSGGLERSSEKFTRHQSVGSRRQSRQSSIHSIPEESLTGQLPDSITASELDKWEGKMLHENRYFTHKSLPQLHRTRSQHDNGSPSESSTSSDSLARASLCWEASVGPRRASDFACPSGADRQAK